MKFTLSWLKDHLDTEASVEEIADTLTLIGLEIEEVVDPSKALEAFRVAEVVSAEKHPDADKLQVLHSFTRPAAFPCRSSKSIPARKRCRSCVARPMRMPA